MFSARPPKNSYPPGHGRATCRYAGGARTSELWFRETLIESMPDPLGFVSTKLP